MQARQRKLDSIGFEGLPRSCPLPFRDSPLGQGADRYLVQAQLNAGKRLSAKRVRLLSLAGGFCLKMPSGRWVRSPNGRSSVKYAFLKPYAAAIVLCVTTAAYNGILIVIVH